MQSSFILSTQLSFAHSFLDKCCLSSLGNILPCTSINAIILILFVIFFLLFFSRLDALIHQEVLRTNPPLTLQRRRRGKRRYKKTTVFYCQCDELFSPKGFGLSVYYSDFSLPFHLILTAFLSAALPQCWLAWGRSSDILWSLQPRCLVTWCDLIMAICCRKQEHTYLQREANTGLWCALMTVLRFYRWVTKKVIWILIWGQLEPGYFLFVCRFYKLSFWFIMSSGKWHLLR